MPGLSFGSLGLVNDAATSYQSSALSESLLHLFGLVPVSLASTAALNSDPDWPPAYDCYSVAAPDWCPPRGSLWLRTLV